MNIDGADVAFVIVCGPRRQIGKKLGSEKDPPLTELQFKARFILLQGPPTPFIKLLAAGSKFSSIYYPAALFYCM